MLLPTGLRVNYYLYEMRKYATYIPNNNFRKFRSFCVFKKKKKRNKKLTEFLITFYRLFVYPQGDINWIIVYRMVIVIKLIQGFLLFLCPYLLYFLLHIKQNKVNVLFLMGLNLFLVDPILYY